MNTFNERCVSISDGDERDHIDTMVSDKLREEIKT